MFNNPFVIGVDSNKSAFKLDINVNTTVTIRTAFSTFKTAPEILKMKLIPVSLKKITSPI